MERNRIKKLGLAAADQEFLCKYLPSDTGEIGKGTSFHVYSLSTMLKTRKDDPYGLSGTSYIVFGSSLCGDGYCFDTSTVSESGHSQIVEASHDEPGRTKKVADDIYDFYQKVYDGTLDG